MRTFEVKIKFTTPYMQHRMDDLKLEEWEKNRKLLIERDDVAQPDLIRAEFHSYKENENYYIPSEHFRCSFINAGGMVKGKVGNATKSMKNIVAASFIINPEKIIIPQWDSIDKRSAVNKLVKARIIVIRPKWNPELIVSFKLVITNDSLTKETIKTIIEYSGMYVGVGSYRPEHNGFFGQFELVHFFELI